MISWNKVIYCDCIDYDFGSEVVIVWSFWPTWISLRICPGLLMVSLKTVYRPFCSDYLNGCQQTGIKKTWVALWISLLIPNIGIAKHLSLNIFSLWCNCGGTNSIFNKVSTQQVGRNGGPNRTLRWLGLCFHFSRWALLFSLFHFSFHIHVWMRHGAF